MAKMTDQLDGAGRVIASAVLILQSLVPTEAAKSVWHPIKLMEAITPYLQFFGLILGLIIAVLTIRHYWLKNKALLKEIYNEPIPKKND